MKWKKWSPHFFHFSCLFRTFAGDIPKMLSYAKEIFINTCNAADGSERCVGWEVYHSSRRWLQIVEDDGWFINAEGAYITAASIDEESVPENGEVYILNDLVGYFTSHTHLGCVADQGFTGESKVKRIYFQDANAQAYNGNSEILPEIMRDNYPNSYTDVVVEWFFPPPRLLPPLVTR